MAKSSPGKLRKRLHVPPGIIQNHPVGTQLLIKVCDILVIVCTLILLAVIDQRGLTAPEIYQFLESNFWLVATTSLLFLIAADLFQVYRSWRWYSAWSEVFCIAKAWAIAAVIILLIIFNEHLGRNSQSDAVFAWLLLVPVTLGLWRIVLRGVLRRLREVGFNKRRVVVVGMGTQAIGFAQELNTRKEGLGMKFLGFCEVTSEKVDLPEDIENPGYIGNFDQLVQMAKDAEVDVVYIALPARRESEIRELIQRLADTLIPVHILIPELYEPMLYNLSRHFGRYRTVSIYTTPFESRINNRIKRLEDLVLATILLIIAAIPIGLIALAVRKDVGSPVLFKQQRYGLGGKSVEIWKFRTMNVLEETNKERQATRNDPRVTRLGAHLRRWSLDELPQLFNVIEGQMSLIGPRPHPVSLNEFFRDKIKLYSLRHTIKPGITGWAQVNGWRGETETQDKMEKRVEHDLYYIKNWSLLLDLKILFLTLTHVLRGNNAV